MINHFFQSIENKSDQSPVDLDDIFENIAFNSNGLIPVITQDATSKHVLMMAWMNKTAIKNTLKTQRMTYWSRSRQNYWVKGETSGHTQQLVSMSLDCDGDALLCLVNQVGGACHTGRYSCFYLHLDIKNQQAIVQGNAQTP
jgi:phosphoribosyl-AMP cyclohydrolase